MTRIKMVRSISAIIVFIGLLVGGLNMAVVNAQQGII